MTERRDTILYRIASAVALLVLYSAVIIGWSEFLWESPGDYKVTIILAAAACAIWLAGRAFYFLSTGR